MVLLSLLLAAASAEQAGATIGDTMEQVIAEARREGTKIRIDNNKNNRPIVTELLADGSKIRHFFKHGRENAVLILQDPITPDVIVALQRSYYTKWYAVEPFPKVAQQSRAEGTKYFPPLGTQVAYHLGGGKYDCLLVYVFDADTSPTNPLPTAPPSSTPDISSPNDCLIVATNALAPLKNSAYWAKIAGFKISRDGKPVAGHAVVFYQPTEGSNVWMYDKAGSRELSTRSHDLAVLTDALNHTFVGDVRASQPRWVEN